MNTNQAKILIFWISMIFACVLTDTPVINRALYYGAFGLCFVLYYVLIAPLYPEGMRPWKGKGLLAWIDSSPGLKQWVPIYYFGLAMFSVFSIFLFPGFVGRYVSTPARLIPVIGFPFIIYFLVLHYDLFKQLGRKEQE